MSLLHGIILVGCFCVGADVCCLLARVLLPPYGVGEAVVATLLGGALGVLLLPRSVTRLASRFLRNKRAFDLRFIIVTTVVFILALLSTLNLKVK